MLTIQQRNHLKDTCFFLELQLGAYKQRVPTPHFLEAKYTLHHVYLLLKKHPIQSIRETLLNFLLERWDRIKNTDVQYCHDVTNPANILCVELAKTLQCPRGRPFLALLMPSLTKTPIDHYITSSWADPVDLKEMMLSDDNERLICIPDALEFALNDGILKHNSTFNGHGKALSFGEKHRLLARHPSVEHYYQAIQDKVNFMLHGETAGAYLSRLIRGLMDGGKKNGASEYDSGEDANVAITEFDAFLKRLSRKKRRALLNTAKIDRVDSETVECMSIQRYWNLLARPHDRRLRHATDMSANFCVELIAGYLDEILKENLDLYQLTPFQETNVARIEELNDRLESARIEMMNALQWSTHYCCYGSEANDLLANHLSRKLAKHKDFTLSVDDIVYIATRYSEIKQVECDENRHLLDPYKKILSTIYSHYKHKVIHQALAQMPPVVAGAFRAWMATQPKAKPSLNTHAFFSPSSRVNSVYSGARPNETSPLSTLL